MESAFARPDKHVVSQVVRTHSIQTTVPKLILLANLSTILLTANAIAAPPDRPSAPVLALLAHKCLGCHHGHDAKGKLDLTSIDRLRQGGESGPAIVAGTVENSLLWRRVVQNEMPPKHPLSEEEKSLLKEWIAAGAPWSTGSLDPLTITTAQRAGLDWWSFQALQPATIPTTRSSIETRQPIDDFVTQRLTARHLSMSPQATRQVVIRRLSFDVLGLPPSTDDVKQFVHDDRIDAYERLVDRLLASPHYGERWARHWLDVVRFGESNGFERDLPRPHAWHYRDWVVDALNRDLPYDEFVRWQLTGDLIAGETPEAMKAVGFLVAGPHDTVIPVVDRMKATMRQDELEDLVGTVSQTFLGLTLNCARCHDHKFDPITTREYYQFASALSGIDHGEREFRTAEHREELAQSQSRIDRLDPLSQRAEIDALKKIHAELTRRMTQTFYTAIVTQPRPMKIHQRGSVTSLGEEVSPAGLSAVRGLTPDFGLRPDAVESHRRSRLAGWITDRRNPLFVRVIVNRIWHYHFGAGLVETPNDLGFHGGLPSHPDLLEWLAREFQRADFRTDGSSLETPMAAGAYSLKRLHRLLVTSATYRQSSDRVESGVAQDAGNRLLWRFAPRRLEAEEVRDAMLAVTGELNHQIGGQGYSDFDSYFFKGTQFYDPIDPVGYPHQRRTLYRMWARGGRSPLLDTFDCPDPSTTTPRRSMTVTPLQALTLLNNSFVLRMSESFADRLAVEGGPTTQTRIALAYQLLYGRSPNSEELTISERFVERRGLTAFCRALWNSSEFLFVD